MIYTYHIKACRDLDGVLLHYTRRTGRRPWLERFDKEAVPPFEGSEADFEVERLPRKPLRFIRQVAPPWRP